MTSSISEERLSEREYQGTGKRHYELLPSGWDKAEPYVASTELKKAVNMAIYLRRPLLLEGEPGTGKTRLAYSVAYELGYPLKAIYIRSTSQAQDLLYTFDAVRRLYDIQELSALAQAKMTTEGGQVYKSSDSQDYELSKEKYIALGQLGEAIQLSMNNVPSVVLIDEIDKADIDFPNDLLLVMDRLQFRAAEVPELEYDALGNATREERRHFLPLLIVTSNREKELPAPFLRRCLYYFIPFPDPDDIKGIVREHFHREITPLFTEALRKFWQLRNNKVFQWRKAPSTSELLDWVRALEMDQLKNELDPATLAETPLHKLPHIGALLKNQVDQQTLAAKNLTAEKMKTND